MMMFLPLFRFVVYSTILGSIISVVILSLRLILKQRLGVRVGYCLWLLLIIKLIMPYGPQSQFSVFNILNLNHINGSNINYVSNTNVKDYVTDEVHTNEEKNYKVPIDNMELNQKHIDSVKFQTVSTKNYGYVVFKIAYFTWFIGVIVLVAFTIIKTVNFCFKLKKQEVCKDKKVVKILEECKREVRLKSNIIVLNNNILKNPAIFGFIRPKLLLPKGICNKVKNNELRYIMLHEMAHLKRKDTAISCIICILQILHWFNPILGYAFYKMRQDREIACDAFALSYIKSDDYIKYGYTIIRLLENYEKSNGVYGVQCIINDNHGIKRRITMISLFKKNSYKWSIISLTILMLVGVITLTNSKKNIVMASKASNKKEQQLNNLTNIREYDIKSKKFNGKMIVVPSSKKIVVGFDDKVCKFAKTTSEIAKKNNAICAINAGRFKRSEDGQSIKPVGVIIHDGKIIYNDLNDKNIITDIVGFDDKGKLIVGKYTLNELKNINIKEAVSFGPALIANGKYTKISGDGGWGIAPRTAIGQKKDGTTLLLTIDGRSIKSFGATIKDVQDIFKEYGAVNASNLDGGSSTTMYYNGEIVNKLSSDKERTVPSTFLVLSK